MMIKKISVQLFILCFLLVNVAMALTAQDGLYTLPDGRDRYTHSSSMVSANNGRTLVMANMLKNTVSIVSPFAPRIDAEIPVGLDPRSVAVTPNNVNALVVNRGDGTVSVVNIVEQRVIATIDVGIFPYGVVAINDRLAAVSVQGQDEIAMLDLTTNQVIRRIPTPRAPAGLAQWGNILYVTHLWSGEFSLIHVPQFRLIDTIALGENLTLSQSVVIDVQRATAYLPQTRVNVDVLNPTFDRLMMPVVNAVDLRNLTFSRFNLISLDTGDRPVNMPFAAAVDATRRWLYVANAGSDNISVIDLTTGLGVASIETDANPRGVYLTRDTGNLYVHSMIEGTINVIDVAILTVEDVFPINDLNVPADIFIGAKLFHTSDDPRLTMDGWISCASCHFDGMTDGRVWQGYAGSSRSVPLLYDLENTAPYTATGAWDELADIETKIRDAHAGTGLIPGAIMPVTLPDGEPRSGRSLDLDNLVTYLYTLKGPQRQPAQPSELVNRGAEVFDEKSCGECHSGASFTANQLHDVGTSGNSSNEFDTPSLRWLWMSAPYFHDGSAETLFDVFIMPGTHFLIDDTSLSDIDALIAYLNSLPHP